MTSYQPTSRDFDVLVSESRSRGIDPRDVALVLYIESAGFDPASAGPGGKGTVSGLNQMNNENLAAIGFAPEGWRALSAAAQLPLLFRWWDGVARDFRPEGFPPTAGDLGAMNILPGRYRDRGAALNPDAPLTAVPEDFYVSNTFYDPDKTGAITVNTLRKRQGLEARGARWELLLRGITDAENRADGGWIPASLSSVTGSSVTEPPRPRVARSGAAGAHLFFGAIVLVFGGVLARGGHR